MLVFVMITLSEAHAGTGDEKKAKTNSESGEKSKNVIEAGKLIPAVVIIVEEKTPTESSVVRRPYYQPSYLDEEVSSSGEDQNAVLSFNVIQYIFQRFKFSEEVY